MVKKILFGMHFWLPLLYTVVFVVISLIAGVLGGNWPFYFLGLSLSLFGSVALTYVTSRRTFAQSREPEEDRTSVGAYPQSQNFADDRVSENNSVAVGNRKDRFDERERDDEALRMYDEQLRYTKDMTATPSQANGEYYESNTDDDIMKGDAMREYYGNGNTRSASGTGGGYINPAPRNDRGDGSFSPYVQPANSASRSGASLSDYDDALASGREQPRIYRLKSEPNVLLYEYRDFFKKYYINPDGSRTLLSTEPKKK